MLQIPTSLEKDNSIFKNIKREKVSYRLKTLLTHNV